MTTTADRDEPVTEGLGLRERKRIRAMRRAQSVALDLFDEHGYEAVTIEQIADRAEISPSSVYRYFGTKEGILLWDEYDPLALGRMVSELDRHSPLEAIREVMKSLFVEVFERDEDRIQRRLRFALEEPSVQAASALQTEQMAETIAALLAEPLGREEHDLQLQVFAHAVVGAMLGAIHHWYGSGFTSPFAQVMDRALDEIEGGLDLDAPRKP